MSNNSKRGQPPSRPRHVNARTRLHRSDKPPHAPLFAPRRWWRRTGLNRRPPACKAGALPLSYAPSQRVLRTAHTTPGPFLLGASRCALSWLGYAPLGPARFLVGPGRFELPTSRLSSARSNQLSYEPGSLPKNQGLSLPLLHAAARLRATRLAERRARFFSSPRKTAQALNLGSGRDAPAAAWLRMHRIRDPFHPRH
jgi:hypothetical protein